MQEENLNIFLAVDSIGKVLSPTGLCPSRAEGELFPSPLCSGVSEQERRLLAHNQRKHLKNSEHIKQ